MQNKICMVLMLSQLGIGLLEGIVNSAPGELPGYDTPNVKANKITFSTGGIGEDSAPVTISREDFKKTIERLAFALRNFKIDAH